MHILLLRKVVVLGLVIDVVGLMLSCTVRRRGLVVERRLVMMNLHVLLVLEMVQFMLERLNHRIASDLFLDKLLIKHLVNRVQTLMECINCVLNFSLHLWYNFISHDFSKLTLDQFPHLFLRQALLIFRLYVRILILL